MNRFAITAILSMSALAVAPVPAQAAPARHCVMSVVDGATTCYSTFQAAITEATGGRVTSAPRAPTADPAFTATLNRAAGTLTAQNSTVIGIEYADDDYRGNSVAITAPYGCDADKNYDYPDWVINSLVPSGWNDEIESFQTFAGCSALHFLHINRDGPALGYWTSWGDLYWMNDEVSSIGWS